MNIIPESIKKWLDTEHQQPLINEGYLRATVGFLAMLLPIALVILGFFYNTTGDAILPSISDYYHTKVGPFFVATLSAVAFFLFAYRGCDGKDIIASRIAGLCALGIVVFPTCVCQEIELGFYFSRPASSWISTLHFSFATLFFLILFVFSFFLFPLSYADKSKLTMRMTCRNIIYHTCGIIMIGAIITIALNTAVVNDSIGGCGGMWYESKGVFWAEAIALTAFGISWLTKSQIFLADEKGHLSS